jgi:hypothetical protein
MHLVLESCPKTLHTHFNYLLKHFYILEMPHMSMLWRLQTWPKLHVMGHFGGAKKSIFDAPNG